MAMFLRKVASGAKFVALKDNFRGAVVGFSVVAATVMMNKSRTFCSTPNDGETATFRPTIYQYLICPFCNRVKSYLDYCGVEYDTIEVNPLTKAEIKDMKLVAKKVPVAIINGQVIEDSAKIIDAITLLGEQGQIEGFPGKEFFSEDTAQWTEWSEKKLAVMLYPNITRTFEESWECFEYAGKVESWSWVQRNLVQVMGTVAMSLANGKIKKKYGIVDERKELKEVINVWCEALQGQRFLHGDQVTMPDILVFGVLKSIHGLRTFNEIMAENSVLKEWYSNVEDSMPAKGMH